MRRHANVTGRGSAALGALVSAALLFGACSGQTATTAAPASAAQPTAAQKTPAPATPVPATEAPTPVPATPVPATAAPTPTSAPDVTLTMWIPTVFTDAQRHQLADFTAATGIKIETEVFPDPFEQNLLTKWAAGDRPDLLSFHAIGNWIVQLNPPENLQDLSNEPFVGRTIPGILEKSSTYQGKTYAAILNYPFLDGVFYNKTIFAANGLTIPHSYQELLALCDTIKQKAPNVAPIYSGGGAKWPLQVLAFTLWNDDVVAGDLIAKVNRNEAKFTDPAFVDGIAKEKEVLDRGCYNKDILTATYEGEQKALMEDRAAMLFQGTWIVGSLLDAYGSQMLNEKVGFFGLSENSNVVSWQTVGTGAFYAPKTGNSEKETAARTFIDWATGPGYQKFLTESKQFPIIQGYQAPSDVPTVLKEANAAFLKAGVPQFQQTLSAQYGAFEQFLSEMIAGDKTPQQVGEALNAEFQRSAKELGLPGF
jgi:raffinose/stachyose/melibiose transport system substrate-binding protein